MAGARQELRFLQYDRESSKRAVGLGRVIKFTYQGEKNREDNKINCVRRCFAFWVERSGPRFPQD